MVNKKDLKRSDIKERFDRLVDLFKRIKDFKENIDYIKLFGSTFKGIETEWNHLRIQVKWAKNFMELLGSENKAINFLKDFLENKERLSISAKRISNKWKNVKTHISLLKLNVKMTDDVLSINTKIDNLERSIKAIVNLTQNYNELSSIDIGSLQTATKAKIDLEILKKEVEGDKRYSDQIGDLYKGFLTDIEWLQSISNWILQIQKDKNLKFKQIKWIISNDTEIRIEALINLIEQTKTYNSKLDDLYEFLSKFGELDFNLFLN